MGSELSGSLNAIPPVNPNIVEDGKATRFGQPRGANPREAGKLTGQPRAAMRYLAAQGIGTDPANAEQEIKDILSRYVDNKGKTSVAAMCAARLLTRMIARPDSQTFNCVAENIEGKLWQPNLNADLSRIQSMNDEEIDAELERLRQAERVNADAGEEAAFGGDEAAAGEAQQISDADTSPSV